MPLISVFKSVNDHSMSIFTHHTILDTYDFFFSGTKKEKRECLHQLGFQVNADTPAPKMTKSTKKVVY